MGMWGGQRAEFRLVRYPHPQAARFDSIRHAERDMFHRSVGFVPRNPVGLAVEVVPFPAPEWPTRGGAGEGDPSVARGPRRQLLGTWKMRPCRKCGTVFEWGKGASKCSAFCSKACRPHGAISNAELASHRAALLREEPSCAPRERPIAPAYIPPIVVKRSKPMEPDPVMQLGGCSPEAAVRRASEDLRAAGWSQAEIDAAIRFAAAGS